MKNIRSRFQPKRGDIYLVNFDPTVGSEIKKTRPAIILQNDIGNRYSPITIVAAITSRVEDRIYPTEVLLRHGKSGLSKDSLILLNQIRSIDKQRLVRKIGRIDTETLRKVHAAIQISLGLVDV
ncbi:MAG: type II toxin-antitoxin system PemK/MazF family toxin [Patescibacteria group bacterium]